MSICQSFAHQNASRWTCALDGADRVDAVTWCDVTAWTESTVETRLIIPRSKVRSLPATPTTEINIQSAAQAAQALKRRGALCQRAVRARVHRQRPVGHPGPRRCRIGRPRRTARQAWGFSRSVRRAPVFYGLVALGTLGGTALSLLRVNPIKLLILVAVINGVAAAPFLVVVMSVSSSRRIMGEYVNGNTAKILGWATAAIMAAAAIALFAAGGL